MVLLASSLVWIADIAYIFTGFAIKQAYHMTKDLSTAGLRLAGGVERLVFVRR